MMVSLGVSNYGDQNVFGQFIFDVASVACAIIVYQAGLAALTVITDFSEV